MKRFFNYHLASSEDAVVMCSHYGRVIRWLLYLLRSFAIVFFSTYILGVLLERVGFPAEGIIDVAAIWFISFCMNRMFMKSASKLHRYVSLIYLDIFHAAEMKDATEQNTYGVRIERLIRQYVHIGEIVDAALFLFIQYIVLTLSFTYYKDCYWTGCYTSVAWFIFVAVSKFYNA